MHRNWLLIQGDDSYLFISELANDWASKLLFILRLNFEKPMGLLWIKIIYLKDKISFKAKCKQKIPI